MSRFFVDRPIRGKLLIYVPAAVAVGERGLRQAIGGRGQVERAEDWRGHRVYEVSRSYTQAVVTYLRHRGGVRFRTERVSGDHCSAACEGAWRDIERGELHENTCQCRCGGYRHRDGRPWWSRFYVLSETEHDGSVFVTRLLPQIREEEDSDAA